MSNSEKSKDFWTRDTLNKLSEVLKDYTQKNQHPDWREFCIEHNFKPGSPDWRVKNAHYGADVVADHYDIEETPIFWEWKNTVVVLNPLFDRKSQHDFFKYKWLEIDAELARKFLVLGIP